jgi:hypothetical protein
LGLLLGFLPAFNSFSQLNITLGPSEYNGYHISCFGAKDGAIDASVTGGTAPYSFTWSNGSTTEDITDLASGLYILRVIDALGQTGSKEITLVEPEQLKVVAEPFKYPSGHNISCHDCFNGSIDVTVYNGVPPDAYEWGDEVYTQDRTGLGALTYSVSITDANGCIVRSEKLLLTQPERKDWTMDGNANTDPAQHFIGTTDAQDVVFKTNGNEILRLGGTGNIRLGGDLTGSGLLQRDATGIVKLIKLDLPPNPELPCADEINPLWLTGGNSLNTCAGCAGALGSMDACPLRLITHGEERIHIAANGQTQLFGTTAIAPANVNAFAAWPSRLNVYASDGQWLRLSTGTNEHWRVLATIETPEEPAGLRFHFTNGIFPPTQGLGPLALYEDGGLRAGPSLRVHPNGRVSIGEVSTNTDYEYQLYVGGGILTERMKVALKTSTEWSDHVFAPNYRLMPLDEVAVFISENGHLPNVPSADCMVEEGMDVVKTNAMLLEKIEELTLHVIVQNERLERAERMIAELTARLAAKQN